MQQYDLQLNQNIQESSQASFFLMKSENTTSATSVSVIQTVCLLTL